jgi:ribosomal protein L11 methyltransferase
VLATRDNAERNGVTERIEVLHSDDFAGHQADLVVANILANILIGLSAKIAGLLRPGGQLVMSGILREQSQAVTAAYADRIEFAPVEMHDDWVLLHGRSIAPPR